MGGKSFSVLLLGSVYLLFSFWMIIQQKNVEAATTFFGNINDNSNNSKEEKEMCVQNIVWIFLYNNNDNVDSRTLLHEFLMRKWFVRGNFFYSIGTLNRINISIDFTSFNKTTSVFDTQVSDGPIVSNKFSPYFIIFKACSLYAREW